MKFNYYINNIDFDIGKILQSGQNILYEQNDNIYSFYYNNTKIYAYTKENITYFSISKSFFDTYLIEFFDMKTNYTKIRKQINEQFPELMIYTQFGQGIRFISQDFLKCCITFIISQNNNIKRILSSVQNIESLFNNSFPDLNQLKQLSIADFRNCGVGFRDRYLYNFVQSINDKWIKELQEMDTNKAYNELINFTGIGPKVANCLLFGLNKRDVFPIDVHIKRILQHIYFSDKEQNINELQSFALNKFGNLSSYIQQYLFYYCIENKY